MNAHTVAYGEGYAAFTSGCDHRGQPGDCPFCCGYEPGSTDRALWLEGYADARDDAAKVNRKGPAAKKWERENGDDARKRYPRSGEVMVPKSSELAKFLRTLAGHIENDRLANPPAGVLVVFENNRGHEVLWCGLETRTRLREAGLAAVFEADLAKSKPAGPQVKLYQPKRKAR